MTVHFSMFIIIVIILNEMSATQKIAQLKLQLKVLFEEVNCGEENRKCTVTRSGIKVVVNKSTSLLHTNMNDV